MNIRFFTALCLVISLVISFIPLEIVEAKSDFKDIAGHPYEASILFLAEHGIVEGYADSSFQPDKIINRVEMLKILMEHRFGNSVGRQEKCFKDVSTEWFARYVCKAKEEGVVEGYSDGFFRPGQRIRMVEGLKMAIEDFQLETTVYEGDQWFEKYVNFAHENELFSKFTYVPNGSMTRGEMSYLVHQLILKEGSEMLDEDSQMTDEAVENEGGESSYLEEGVVVEKKDELYYTNSMTPSAGCGLAPPSVPPSEMMIDTDLRQYITVIPDDYESNRPIKLVFAFHGRTNSNEQVRSYYGIEEAIDGQAIVVYPSGLPNNSSPRHWKDSDDSASNLRDYVFFDQLLEQFSNQYCIDLDHVYVVGHSLGAWFANSLACFRGDVIRGVGSLGGGNSAGECVGFVAAMVWHNPNDQLSPFESGELARDQFIAQNHCSNQTQLVEPSEGNCVEYQDCNSGAPLVWCPHTIDYSTDGSYYPHTWPSMTGEAIWDFFERLDS